MDYDPFWEVARATSSDDPAHDILHVTRVVENAIRILDKEVRADRDIVIPAILLHELFNYPKGHTDSKKSGDICAERAAVVLDMYNYPQDKQAKVLDCIRFHSFSRGVVPSHLEGKIVQDADRLDAIGAVGIARLFATCTEMKTPFYAVEDPFGADRVWDDKRYGIDHFYIKLFRITDSLHTDAARTIAKPRVAFMQRYIDQLRLELG